MRITILGSGTSCGVPLPTCQCDVCQSADTRDKRLRASVLIENDDNSILIDCGPDMRQQMLANNVMQLQAVLLTHIHYDHSAGIDDLRAYTKTQTIPLYCEKDICEQLTEKYDYIFQHQYPGVPKLSLQEIAPNQPFRIGNMEIMPLRLYHGQLPILGYRIGNMAYLTDCTGISDSALPLLQHLEVLIIDALRIKPHPTHYSVEQALEVVNKLKPRTTFFTHMSHEIGLHADVSAQLPKDVFLAYDQLHIDL